jgi:hypothetical protein
VSRLRRLLAAILVAAVAGAAGAGASHALFDGASSNPGSTVTAGTVAISDNDSGASLFELSGMKPGNPATRCVRVTYDGDIAAAVRLYGSSSGGLAPYVNLTVERGRDSNPSFSSCASFTPEEVVYEGTLAGFPSSYSTGAGSGTWAEGEAHSYRITAELANNPAAQGLAAQATLTWEARDT